jgi:uncharacterized membrane protein
MGTRPDKNKNDPYGIDELTNALQDMVTDVAHAVSEGAQAVRHTMRRTGEEEKRQKQLRKQQKSAANTARGLGIAAFVCGLSGFVALFDGTFGDALSVFIITAGLALASHFCKRKAMRLQRVLCYRMAVIGHGSCSVSELAAATGCAPETVHKEVLRLLQNGDLEGMRLSADGARLFENQAAYSAYQERCAQAQQSEAETQPTRPEQAVNDMPDTLGRCRAFVQQLTQARASITDASVGEQVELLTRQAAQIAEWLEQHPAEEPKVKRFADYYMPTVLKLLNTYNAVSRQAGESAVAENIQTEICGILYTVNQAFHTLQDGLLQDTALDVSAEIAALETVLTQDGLTPPEF